MSDNAGRFVWCEWMGEDLEAAVGFYRHVLGWDIADFPLAPGYKVASLGKYAVGGMMATPADAKGAPPCWTGYVGVADVDAAVAKLEAAGGGVMRPPTDIPGVGRFAIVKDPQGAAFALFRGAGGPPMDPPPPETAGLVGWRELLDGDGESALAFYAGQFGWTEARQFDMGPMGVYRIFDNGGQQGGVMPRIMGPGPCWLYYFNVEAAEAGNARVLAKGGKVLNGPHQVPGGQFATQCADAEGAIFGLVAPKL